MRNIAVILTVAAMSMLAESSSYRVTRTYTLGGDGSWDYVVPDPPNHRLFIARQNRVMVVDEDSGKLLGEVTGIQGAHGTAIAGGTGHGFATSGNDQSVVMFDLKTFRTLGRIPAAEDADAIVYDSASNRVFTLNGDAHSSTVIDPRAGSLITNIPLGGKPEYGVSAGDGKVYANLTDTGEVVEIDAKPATVARRCWLTAPCKQPVAMAASTPRTTGCSVDAAAEWMAVSDYRGRQGGRDGPDRRRCRWGRVRCGLRQRLRLECRRHAHRDSSGRSGPIPRHRKCADAAGVAQHGARPHESPRVRRLRQIWARARGSPCQGETSGIARIVCILMVIERDPATRA